jgi:PncC family amidohydrolase
MSDDLLSSEFLFIAEHVVKKLAETSKILVAAESCTAGLVADALARIPGASRVLWGSFVCYTVDAKDKMLGVDTVEQFGAVSKETALAMARGALARSSADIAVAITGLAGPDGDGSGVKVGTVWIAAATGEKDNAEVFHFNGSRNEVRLAAAEEALRFVSKVWD